MVEDWLQVIRLGHRKWRYEARVYRTRKAAEAARATEIERLIRYEEYPGCHTYHPCKCGRFTRCGMCAECLRGLM